MKRTAHILILCLLAGLFLVEDSTASICDTRETIVFFGNGVRSIKKDAFKAKESIKKHLRKELSSDEFKLLDFDISYNDTHALPLDLLESTMQLLTGNVSRFWRILFGHEIIPDWFAEKFILLAKLLDKSTLVTTDSLRDHVKTYQAAIAEGKKIILVAHSQGNLFGNEAYTLLDSHEKQSFGMVSVANVDSNVLGDGSDAALYTTLDNDKVILALIAVQLGLPTSPMMPNTENLGDSDTFWGHSFLQSYMVEGSESDRQIVGDIITVLDSLATPSQIVKPGVITVSLTWGSAPDVDLHVYEPNGTHVYWYNLTGPSGTLDRDDRSRWGPEHYHVPACDTLEEGIYHIALDYYEGEEPESATIQIEAGLLSRTFEVAMPSDLYGTPYNPRLAANIWVRTDDSGGYEFEIFK